MQDETLKQLAAWVLTGGGAGVLAYWVIDHLNLSTWNDEQKRWLAWALGGIAAIGFWWLEIAMLWVPNPADWREGLSQGVAVLGMAFMSSQMLQARVRQARIYRARQQLRG
jgi:hypothetical protein